MMDINWKISNWQDLESFISILAFPVIAISVFVAFLQIKAQARLSAGEISGQALLQFYENFTRTAAMRRDLQGRFQAGDATITRHEVLQYYYQYWQQRELEWEYFAKGLISVDLFTRWSENCVKHMLGRRDLGYYEAGKSEIMSSRQVFETNVLNSILLRSVSCRRFYVSLCALADKLDREAIALDSDQAYRDIKTLVKRQVQLLKIKNYDPN
ncbi:hypothetical protein [Asticcacaulis machinosus]|uniref:Phage abortive infection protein n=1 Tax=Asticcacaulis machinosus TaxID=2984211 RepID=A0ABT5HHY4_9CAUL|nr:hypothetical protein [Asticcacaulis machinosus]MDC7675860.1 hypothetical protein [Asticcacaulis machinosus]